MQMQNGTAASVVCSRSRSIRGGGLFCIMHFACLKRRGQDDRSPEIYCYARRLPAGAVVPARMWFRFAYRLQHALPCCNTVLAQPGERDPLPRSSGSRDRFEKAACRPKTFQGDVRALSGCAVFKEMEVRRNATRNGESRTDRTDGINVLSRTQKMRSCRSLALRCRLHAAEGKIDLALTERDRVRSGSPRGCGRR